MGLSQTTLRHTTLHHATHVEAEAPTYKSDKA
jgi:hypothetical protein